MADNNLTTFINEEFGSVRTIVIREEPWFVGKDVATALGYSNSRDAISKHVEAEDKGVTKCDTLGGKQELLIINESGLYSLVFSSKLETARKFKHWITSVVIPSLRKNGGYIMKQETKSDEEILASALNLANKILKEREATIDIQNQELENKDHEITGLKNIIRVAQPMVKFAEGVATSEGDIDFGDYAAYLQNDCDINVGRNILMEFCRDRGYLCGKTGSWNRPSQRMITSGYMTYQVIPVKVGGKNIIHFKPLLTGKGQLWLYKQIKEWYSSSFDEDMENII